MPAAEEASGVSRHMLAELVVRQVGKLSVKQIAEQIVERRIGNNLTDD